MTNWLAKNLECLSDDAKIFEKTGDFALISDVLRTTIRKAVDGCRSPVDLDLIGMAAEEEGWFTGLMWTHTL